MSQYVNEKMRVKCTNESMHANISSNAIRQIIGKLLLCDLMIKPKSRKGHCALSAHCPIVTTQNVIVLLLKVS